jgi:GntR family transcriptional regulator
LPTPRYRELADDLREAILNEQTLLGCQLTDGGKMPTEPELANHFQVSRGTIRQALGELAAAGLIETRGRSGTYVRRLPLLAFNVDSENPNRRDEQGTSDAWDAVVKKSGRTPSHDFSFRIEPASAEVAGRMEIEQGELVVVREMLRFVDDVPWIDQQSYYPYKLAQECGLDVPQNVPEGTVRRMAKFGYAEDHLAHEVSGRPASEEERQRFDLAPGVTALIYRRVGRSNGRVVRYTREVLPADRNVVTSSTAVEPPSES